MAEGWGTPEFVMDYNFGSFDAVDKKQDKQEESLREGFTVLIPPEWNGTLSREDPRKRHWGFMGLLVQGTMIGTMGDP